MKKFTSATLALLFSVLSLTLFAAPEAQALRDTKFKSNLVVTGNTTVGGTLAVTGAQTFTGNAAVTGNLTVGGTQAVTGVATFTASPVVPNGSFARTKLATESAVASVIVDLQAGLRTITGLVLDATGGAALHKIVAGAYGTGTMELRGDDANNNTITSTSSCLVSLPDNYVAGSAITLRMNAKTSGSGTITVRTIDAEVYKLAADGTAGSDICATAAQTTTGTAANYDFTITPTGLAAGDKLRINIQQVLTITDATATRSHLHDVRLLMDIKG